MQKITPFLWFNGQAEQAAKFYTSIFPKSKIRKITHYGDAVPGPKGSNLVERDAFPIRCTFGEI